MGFKKRELQYIEIVPPKQWNVRIIFIDQRVCNLKCIQHYVTDNFLVVKELHTGIEHHINIRRIHRFEVFECKEEINGNKQPEDSTIRCIL